MPKTNSIALVFRPYKEITKNQKYAVHYIEEAKILKRGKEKGKEEGIEIGTAKGKKEGKKEGKIEGEKSKAIKIAKELIKNRVGVNIIIKSTGLSKAQITKLSKAKKRNILTQSRRDRQEK